MSDKSASSAAVSTIGIDLGKIRPRQTGATALPRTQEHPAHGSVHGAFARPLPGLLEGLIARSRLNGPRKATRSILRIA
jgi:hypothetical protein